MKKISIWVILIGLLILPFKTQALEMEYNGIKYTATNLEETLKEEGIEKAYANYIETDEQVPIYLFRGTDCEYCKDFLNFLNNKVNEIGNKFRLVSFEIYGNQDNNNLLTEVAEYIGAEGDGIPFIVIGNQYFEGYSSSYDEAILDAINTNYAFVPTDRADIFKSLIKKSSSDTRKIGTSTEFKIIAWNFIFILLSTIGIIFFINYKMGKLDEKISMINNKGKR